ncbi:hypothetical protein [Actinorugispora endophytica]|uniref:Uncharacterized protein n=1 Tax=Actinorugispora endophytica TaxID=1605990 RepID=A0A4R6V2T5_9ACTN|nr:hypothetical protein [Actinorugispora endophytica]TDQ54494.1 hypothetical protein EV190_102328 [Actinorugispora endophytica]
MEDHGVEEHRNRIRRQGHGLPRDWRRTLKNTRTARGARLGAATVNNRLAAVEGNYVDSPGQAEPSSRPRADSPREGIGGMDRIVDVPAQWVEEARPACAHAGSPALWPSERGPRIG